MTIVSEIDPQRSLVLTHVSGVFTEAEAIEHEKTLGRQADFRADYAQLFDASLASWEEISSDCLRMIATLTPFAPTAKRAYVVKGQFGRMLAIIFGVHSSLNEQYFYVTDQLDMAYDWLNVAGENKARKSFYRTEKIG